MKDKKFESEALLKGKEFIDDLLEKEDKSRVAKISFNEICRSIATDQADYIPRITINKIDAYTKLGETHNRILYSELSSFYYGLDDEYRGAFVTNSYKLWKYASNTNNNLSDDCRRIAIKIYDHTQLVVYQLENMNALLQDGIREMKADLTATSKDLNELKESSLENKDLNRRLQKELRGSKFDIITIIGLFSGLIIAFFGGFNYISSSLASINDSNIFKSAFAISLVGFVVFNTIYILLKMVIQIAEYSKDDKTTKVGGYVVWINIVFVLMIIFFGWMSTNSIDTGYILELFFSKLK